MIDSTTWYIAATRFGSAYYLPHFDMKIVHMPDGWSVFSDTFTHISGPFPTLDAAKVAYMILC